MKTLNMFYLVIYWTQKVHNDFIFLCSIILPPDGHSSNHECHCWNLQDNRAIVGIFIALLRFSVDSPSYKITSTPGAYGLNNSLRFQAIISIYNTISVLTSHNKTLQLEWCTSKTLRTKHTSLTHHNWINRKLTQHMGSCWPLSVFCPCIGSSMHRKLR